MLDLAGRYGGKGVSLRNRVGVWRCSWECSGECALTQYGHREGALPEGPRRAAERES